MVNIEILKEGTVYSFYNTKLKKEVEYIKVGDRLIYENSHYEVIKDACYSTKNIENIKFLINVLEDRVDKAVTSGRISIFREREVDFLIEMMEKILKDYYK